ncbi:hypothetical protein [Halobacteriovorax sp. JY17]|uniref:hypothetical protein n=1 Tax=Halobacteriovorax sp. JY17 TaxID=2014617 RepID=UPI000C66B9CB|nr:hypothetical protein [Halobacteriovorax sp. JY17]PIK15898.1 MAG: hypothetical protein CES88_04005 [Halobacteriovorax sp. JY17]
MEPIKLVKLIGSAEESFYQLGLKDRDGHTFLLKHMQTVLSLGIPKVDKILQEIAANFFDHQQEKNSEYKLWLENYSQGLGISPKELVFTLLLPELSSCLSKWLPSLSGNLLGCSTFFFWDDKEDSPTHGRILDFPLVSSFDKYERTILYDFPDLPKVYSFSSTGFPFPSISSMNEYGVTLALHQKFTDILNISGRSVFDIGNELIFNTKNLEDAIKILKKAEGITTWCFNMTFPDGRWLSADLMGDKLEYKTGEISKGEITYFNNDILSESLETSDYHPYAIAPHNEMRACSGREKIKNLLKKKELKDLDVLISMATPLKEATLTDDRWNLDTLTPSSVQILTLNPSKGKALSIAGEAPKIFVGNYEEHLDIWNNPSIQLKTKKLKNLPVNFKTGLRDYMMAQVAFDHKDFTLAYHHIQMAHDALEGTKWEVISEFYFLVFQFMKEKHKKVRATLLDRFQVILPGLPPVLQDHAWLYISRLERILHKTTRVSESNIKHPALKKVLSLESKIPNLLLHRSITLLMAPRLDLVDVIYPLS